MFWPASIFFDFSLPNATTWFYFSFLLAVALFFKFSRWLSVRNWDIITLFLLVPGFLLLQESHTRTAIAVSKVVGSSVQVLPMPGTGMSGIGALGGLSDPDLSQPTPLRIGYLWLLVGTAYFLVRCLIDLTLERRPALGPNLDLGGLAWFSGALFVCLAAVAIRNPPENQSDAVGKTGAPLDLAQRPARKLVETEPSLGLTRDQEIQFWVQRGLALICHLAVGAGLIVIGYRHFQDPTTGMAAATLYLLLPYTGIHVGQLHHVWPTALIIWAVVCYRLPALSGLLLGLAAGTAYFPALIFPIWISFYWKRGAGRFAFFSALSAAICLVMTAVLLWIEGELDQTIQSAIALSDWQPWKVPTTESFWSGIHWVYRIPVFIAFLAFLVTTSIWPAPKNLAHVLALSAAILIGTQLWYADQGGVYVLWYMPLLLLVVFRPNLADRRPALIQPETDWVVRWKRACVRFAACLAYTPQPLAKVRALK